MIGRSNVTRLRSDDPLRAIVISRARDERGGFLIGAMKRRMGNCGPERIGACYRAASLDEATRFARDMSRSCGLAVIHSQSVTA